MQQEAEQLKIPLILSQIIARLHDIFDGLIDLSDVESKQKDDQERYFITRAFLALCLMDEVGITAAEAASCITDGGADDGIDAVFVDKKNDRIYFCQSKWRVNMKKGVELNDFVRFRDGVKNVIMGVWTKENANIHKYRSEIENQLSNIDTNVVMILAHTSENDIAENIYAKISEFLLQENKYTDDFLTFKEFKVSQAARVARSNTRPENINLPVMLAHWGLLLEPYRAVYGSVAALDVTEWFEQHGNKLFAENLRYGIEKSDVNDGIMATAHKEPQNFWYYNNGITAICDSVDKQPIGGPDTSSGIFNVNKISVINGAQTITSLHRARKSGADLSKVRVHLRIISISDTQENFAPNVTSANNTQNDLNPVDFVAADPNQNRIRREASQIGLIYSYRRGDKDPERSQGFNIRSATIAAACASGDLRLAVAAKRYISGLWENTKKEPYTKLFNGNTTAVYLSRIIRIMNAVDDALVEKGNILSGREKLTSVHANRFILFCVFNLIRGNVIEINNPIEPIESEAKKLTYGILSELNKLISENFADAYPGNIFKNQERQIELLELMK